MADILATAKAYSNLLDVEYQILLGKKNKNISLAITFEEMHFFHLAGFQYLEDIPDIFRSKREKLFNKILNGGITQTQIESSKFYPHIKDRIEYLAYLEAIMDSNETVFKYNPRLEAFSAIQADFLLKNEMQSRNIFTFLSSDKSSGKYFCRSFFPQIDKDYSKGQTNWTLLFRKRFSKSRVKKLYFTIKSAEAPSKTDGTLTKISMWYSATCFAFMCKGMEWWRRQPTVRSTAR